MCAILGLYALGACLSLALFRLVGRAIFAIMALIPAAAFAWAASWWPLFTTGQATPFSWDIHADVSTNNVSWTWQWISGLSFDLAFRMDVLSWVMLLVINGAGTLIMLYCFAYFSTTAVGLRRFVALFLGFALSMNGLVLADHFLLLYVFWEMTALFSFLLIGHHFTYPSARGAARQAFMVTTLGSLVMFGGFFVLWAAPGGTFNISQFIFRLSEGAQLLANPAAHVVGPVIDPRSPMVITGVLLVMCGALTKSAMVPFHFWLPAAMAAPTPVSAFLHAASMVKAGVFLVLRFSPAATHVPGFWLVGAFGGATMLVGAYRALRQRDLKLVLAYGTVSQLGFMIALASCGQPATQVAALIVLLAHATFKSSLFLSTGTVEKLTGTRDLTELSGVGRRHPVLAISAACACASMAGIPITAGYVGKELAIHTLSHGNQALLSIIVVGSMMTLAYALRYWWGAFATKSHIEAKVHSEATPAQPPSAQKHSPLLIAVPLVLAGLSVALGWATGVLQALTEPMAHVLAAGMPVANNPVAHSPATHNPAANNLADFVPAAQNLAQNLAQNAAAHVHIGWWSGWQPAVITAGILMGGVVLFLFGNTVYAAQERVQWPRRASAANVYAGVLRGLETLAGRTVAVVQRGSLPHDLVVIVLTTLLATGAAAVYAGVRVPSRLYWADFWLQLGLGALIIAVAVVVTVTARRMSAAVALGGVGAGIAVLFFTFGGPDLALTQLVVEAVSLVVFVLVFRRLPVFFSQRPMRSTKFFRAVLSGAVGVGVVALGLVVGAARKHLPVSALLPKEVKEFGQGENIVNVVLVDVRAWDTVGELTVLLIAALGVTSLIYVKAMSTYIDTSPRVRRTRVFNLVVAQRRKVERIRKRQKLAAEGTLANAQVSSSAPGGWLFGAGALPLERRVLLMEVSVRILFHTLMLVSVWLLLIGHNNPGGGFVAGMTGGIALCVRYIAGGRFELFTAAPFKPGHVLGVGLFVAALAGIVPVFTGGTPFQTVPIHVDFGWAGTVHFTTAVFLDIGVYIVVMGVVLDILASLGAQIDRHIEETPGATDKAITAVEGTPRLVTPGSGQVFSGEEGDARPGCEPSLSSGVGPQEAQGVSQ